MATLATMLLASLVLFEACRDQPSTAPLRHPISPSRDVAPAAAVEFYIHSAPEDWQLFMSDVTAASLQRGAKVVLVHTSAGDAGGTTAFWQARESGSLASVDAIVGAGTWSCAPQSVGSHSIQRCAKANAVVYFMRMPDGGSAGTGYGHGSLSTLRDYGTATSSIDASATYTSWADFTGTIVALIGQESPGQPTSAVAVHSPDFNRTINPGDSPDNYATGDAVHAAIQGVGYTIAWYVGFNTSNLPVNLSAAAQSVKQQIFTAYDNTVVAAGFGSDAGYSIIQAWLARTYYRLVFPPTAPTNLVGVAAANTRVNLTWTNNSNNATGFYIDRAPDASGVAGTYAQIGNVGPTVTAYSDLLATPNTKYWYRARAYNDGGAGASNQVSVATPLTTPLPYEGDAYVMAHADDWQLFAGDFAFNSFQNAATVVFVYVTAGDAGNPAPYWQARERGAMASIDAIVGGGAWTCAARTIKGHPIQRCSKAGFINYFMRMPDGNNTNGLGYGFGSISDLRDNGNATFTLDGSTEYLSWSDLYNTISSIITTEFNSQSAPYVQIHTQDYTATTDPGDHFDHYAVGDAMRAAAGSKDWNVWYHVGYDTQNRPINISDTQHSEKMTEYTPYDQLMYNAGYGSNLVYANYQAWLWRDYNRFVVPNSATLKAPTSLAATVASMTEIDLTWVASSNTASTYIERAPDNNGKPGSFARIDSIGPNVTAYASTGLAAGTAYWYRLRSIDATGLSPYTAAVTAKTLPPPPPAAPTALTLKAVSATQINLSWTNNAVPPLSGFLIERAPDAGGVPGTYAQIASVAATARTYSNTGLTELTTYWYRVRAYNTGGNSAYSNEINMMTLTGMPAAPSNLRATPLSGTSIALDWNDNSNNELGFQIYQAPDVNGAPGTFTWIKGVGTNVTTYTVKNLTAATVYWFAVRATYIDTSAYSNFASAMTTPPAPPAPTALVANGVSGSEIDLTWTDNGTIETSYTVYRAPNNNGAPGTYNLIATLAAHATSYNNTGLASGTTYWYSVQANNAGGASPAAVASGATQFVAPPPPPAAPSGLTLTPSIAAVGQDPQANQVSLAWTNNATTGPLSGFYIERAPDAGGVAGAYVQIASVGPTIVGYTDAGLSSLKTFWYRVRAYNTTGPSAYSNAASVTTLNAIPATPTGLRATTLSSTSIALDWTDNATNELGYQIYQAPDVSGAPGTFVWIGGLGANANTFTVNGLTPSTKYWYRVQATTDFDSSAVSNNASATTNATGTLDLSSLTTGSGSGSQLTVSSTGAALPTTGYTLQPATNDNAGQGAYSNPAVPGPNAANHDTVGDTATPTYWGRVSDSDQGAIRPKSVTSSTAPTG